VAGFFYFSGLVVASFCYLQFFPPPYHVDGMLYAPVYYFSITLTEYMYRWDSPCTPFWLWCTHLHHSLKYWLQKEWGVFISLKWRILWDLLYIILTHRERNFKGMWLVIGRSQVPRMPSTKIARANSSPIFRDTVAKATLYSIKKEGHKKKTDTVLQRNAEFNYWYRQHFLS